MRSLSPGAPSAWHPSLRPYYRGKICIQPHSPTPIIPLYVMKRERGREVGANQGVVRERRKDITVQPIPPGPPASLTIFLHPKPFYPSNGNPEAHQYHINHIQCLWHSISANDAAMAAELPLLIAAISPSALPASPLTRWMNTDAIKNRTCGNCRLWFHLAVDEFIVVVDHRAAEILLSASAIVLTIISM